MTRFLQTLLVLKAATTLPVWCFAGPPVEPPPSQSIATAGDVNGDGFSDLIVGAPMDANGEALEGRVLVYHGSHEGLAVTPAWIAEGNQPGAEFGNAVATAGDVNGDGFSDILIGAWKFNSTLSDEGRVYLYLGSSAGLAANAAWTIDGGQTGARLGGAVAPAGDVNGDGFADVIVGAPYFDAGGADAGWALVFLGSPSGLPTTPAWTFEGTQAGAALGSSVAPAGDVNGDGLADILVGAPRHADGLMGAGRAWIFHGSAAGVTLAPAWTAGGTQQDERFAAAVSTAGDVNGDGYSDVLVGAPQHAGSATGDGRAYVYHGGPAGASAAFAWMAEGAQEDAYFGSAVAVAGDIDGDGYCDVLIGAPGYDAAFIDAGRVSIYRGGPAGLASTAIRHVDGIEASAGLGSAVAPGGDVNGDGHADIVGAVSDGTKVSAALIQLGTAFRLAETPAWTSESDQAGAAYGWSVASAGDVNGDGLSDVVVGAINYTNGETREGAVFVYHGTASGLSPTPNWTAESNQAFAEFGYSAGSAGDVNGDGYDDLIVGAPQYSNGEFAEGRAWLYLGSPTGLATIPAWTAESNQAEGRMGRMVGPAGDVNADGYADVFLGSYSYTNGEIDEGLALVYHGSPSGLGENGTPANADWRTEGNQPSAWYGRFGGTAGDVNGDGYGDVIVGAYRFSNGQDLEGAAFVYHGSPSGLSAVPAWIGESNQVNAAFGFAANSAGDVNGDGFSDVIVGAVNYYGGQFWEGAAFVYLGGAGGLSAAPCWMVEGNQIEARLGWSVGAAGDVNGDGFGDILVSSHLFDDDQLNEGRTFIYLGSPSGPAATPSQTIDGHQSDAQFGFSSARAGDVNGDGFSDVIIGANAYDGGQQNAGRASLYYGNDRSGIGIVPRQRRVNSNGPVAHRGRSDVSDAITLAAIGRTPFGRARVKLQWEIKPFGEPLNGNGTQQAAAYIDTGISGTPLSATPTILNCGVPYHWSLRLRYDPAGVPFAPHGRWVNLQANSRQEADLRAAPIPGDMNCDCVMNPNDVPALVSALLDSNGHTLMYPRCSPGADMQPDGDLNGADVAAFVGLLIGP